MIDERLINNWFTYHPPTSDQTTIYETLRAHAREFAHIINNLVPDGADKSDAMRKLREVVMTANAAVATGDQTQLPYPDKVTIPVAPARRADAPAQTSVWPQARHAAPETSGQPIPIRKVDPGRSMDEMVAEYLGQR